MRRTVVVLVDERHPVLEEGAGKVDERNIGRLVGERLQLRPTSRFRSHTDTRIEKI